MRRGRLYLLVAVASVVELLAGHGPVAAQGTAPAAQGTAPTTQASAPAAPQPLPPVASDDPWFGAVQSIAAPQAALNAGVKWQRLIFAWNQIQPDGPGDFKQGDYSDAQVDAQIAQGLPVVGITLYTPRWAARDPQYDARSVPKNLDLPIDNPQNYFAAYMKQLVAKYRGRIDTWIIYNEPDMYAEPNDYRTFAGSPIDYYLLLKTAYLAAKSANPNARIVMAGYTYWWDHENHRPLYFQRVLDAIGGDPTAAANNWFFDVVDVHAYANPLNSYTIPVLFRRALQAKGLDKPIWITESNVLVKNDPRVGAGDGPFRATQDEQASYVIESVALARAAGVQRYSIYKMQDQYPENGDEYWGLTRNDGSLRPAYVAYQVAVKYLQQPRSAVYYWGGSQVPPTEQEITTLLASNTNRYQWPWPAPLNVVVLDRGTQRVTVIWNASPQPLQVSLPAAGRSAQIVDKYGQVRTVTPTNGGYPLDLEPSRNNSDPRDTSLYLVGGSPWIVVEDLGQSPAPAPAATADANGRTIDADAAELPDREARARGGDRLAVLQPAREAQRDEPAALRRDGRRADADRG